MNAAYPPDDKPRLMTRSENFQTAALYKDFRHTTDPPPFGRGLTDRHVPDPRMGDDGTGHCRGCGCSIGTFNEGCEVCMYALDVIHGVAS